MAKAATPLDAAQQDMLAFLKLSAALTGMDIQLLDPEFDAGKDAPGVDPINVKAGYFTWIRQQDPAGFAALLQIAVSNSDSPANIISKVNVDDRVRALARSVVLLWYLGAWYEPDDLQKKLKFPRHRVLSAKAYTQGLVWQIAGAHPMGYSNLQFGYWARMPQDPNNAGDFFSPPTPKGP
jgi:hypothetical protein